jgi:nitroimidazol reductase NimA-like FMN-containing flavoprotein (pyridoxamine 5'-phosphate oxidase superfamily)
MQPNMEKFHLSDDEIYALLDRVKEGVLCTVGKDGYPYCIPVNFVRIGNKIYFHGRKSGEKNENMEACDKVCLTAVETGGFEITGPDGCNTTTVYESVIVRGTVRTIEDLDKKIAVLRAIIAKTVPERAGFPMKEERAAAAAVFEMSIETATGKYHKPMPDHKVMH